MAKITISTGRLSDLATRDRRADWSQLKARIVALDPGQELKVKCSSEAEVPRMRSTILVIGRRAHQGEWRVTTRTEGKTIHVFLGPAS